MSAWWTGVEPPPEWMKNPTDPDVNVESVTEIAVPVKLNVVPSALPQTVKLTLMVGLMAVPVFRTVSAPPTTFEILIWLEPPVER